MTTSTALTSMRGKKSVKEREGVRTPSLAEADWFQRAVGMVERPHRPYLRTLKALQDQRRTAGVVVRHAGQINVAQQQVNLNAPCGRA